MTEFAKPCIRCDKKLENIDRDAINQPHEGTTFETLGHYGSTFFDPMDGSYLELNICDECLEHLTSEHKILFGRERQPVVYDGLLVGWRTVHRELTDYDGQQDERQEISLSVDREDIGTDRWDKGDYKVEWLVAQEDLP